MTGPDWLHQDAERSAAWAGRQDGQHELLFAILAGEAGTFMGKPIRFEVSWPEGVPHGFTEESLQAWAVDEVAKLRARAVENVDTPSRIHGAGHSG